MNRSGNAISRRLLDTAERGLDSAETALGFADSLAGKRESVRAQTLSVRLQKIKDAVLGLGLPEVLADVAVEKQQEQERLQLEQERRPGLEAELRQVNAEIARYDLESLKIIGDHRQRSVDLFIESGQAAEEAVRAESARNEGRAALLERQRRALNALNPLWVPPPKESAATPSESSTGAEIPAESDSGI